MTIRDFNSIPDYTGDRYYAKQLADRVQDYYHNLGYKNVKVWVEGGETPGGRKLWSVRSNLSFDFSKLTLRLLPA